jgi:DNA-binding SARP family transcriptional activator
MTNLTISTFGDFSISFNDKTIGDKNIRSKKSCILLSYLITHRKKPVTQMKLFDVLWKDNESNNPLSALKTLLSRTRVALSELGYPDAAKLIKSSNGSYFWNNDIPVTVDIDVFEEYYNLLHQNHVPIEDKIKYAKKAIEIYKGPFLANYSSEYWVIPMSTYYHSLFIEIINTAINFLYNKNDFIDIIKLCKNAITIAPYEEDLYYHLINSQYETGNNKEAIEQYRNVESFFYNTFGVSLSDKFSELYKKINTTKNNLEFDLEKIHDDLIEKEKARGAFLCEYELFKQHFQLEIRASQRNNSSLQICLVSVVNTKGGIPPLNKLNPYIEKLENVIKSSLRASDIFARYSVSQYIIMLPDTSYENAHIVLDRIKNNCKQAINIHGVGVHLDLKNYCEASKELIK